MVTKPAKILKFTHPFGKGKKETKNVRPCSLFATVAEVGTKSNAIHTGNKVIRQLMFAFVEVIIDFMIMAIYPAIFSAYNAIR